MVRIAPLALLLGLLLVGAGVATCVTAAPDDPRTFPALEDALILGGVAAMALGASRRRLRSALGTDDPPRLG
ncbi:MAG TPA: hypothetical protein PKW35_06530 [Nannocystaceae bacterium]|nr:hypothetical protein [Nannocystaceae bacterium]